MQFPEQVEAGDDIPWSWNPSMCSETVQSPSYGIHKPAMECVKNIVIVHTSLLKKAST